MKVNSFKKIRWMGLKFNCYHLTSKARRASRCKTCPGPRWKLIRLCIHHLLETQNGKGFIFKTLEFIVLFEEEIFKRNPPRTNSIFQCKKNMN